MSFDYTGWFEKYVALYRQALSGELRLSDIRGYFAPSFLALTAEGGVTAGQNDKSFNAGIEKGFAFYRSIGMTDMRIDHIEVDPLYNGHDRVRVFYVATLTPSEKASMRVPFDILYLTQRQGDKAYIFAYLSADEMTIYRNLGILSEADEPASV